MSRFGAGSLFWRLAGSFFLVLVLAIALQAVVVVTIIEPIARRAARERADALLVETSAEISDLFAGTDPESRSARPGRVDAQIAAILRSHRLEAGQLSLQFRHRDGRVVGMRPFPPGWRGRGGGMGRRLPPAEDLDAGEGPPVGMPPREGRPSRGPVPGGPGSGRPGSRLEPLSHRAVVADGDTLGEVLALTPPRRFFFLPADVPGSMLLFFPIAILIAGAAGLLTVRSLTGRLRSLEALAGRIAEGDLEARVAAPAPDEIGRLGAALNLMAGRLEAARNKAQEGERQRVQLLADISHELATPMTSIRGYAETLLDPAVPLTEAEREEYLTSVLAESKRLDGLIQDLFELNRLEAGALPLTLERLDWTALCLHTVRRLVPRFKSADLALRWSGPEAAAWIVADGRRMEQVLENLLVNALRYVPAGGSVTISLGPGDDPSRARLTVADDGPGISPKDLPHIFERFYRADEARASGGTGLGLAIVRQIVMQHGGSVRVEPRSPRGTRFIVEIPGA